MRRGSGPFYGPPPAARMLRGLPGLYTIMRETKKEGLAMKVMEASENYLETILMLQKEKPHVRSIDVAHALGYSRPTISIVMKKFQEDGYIGIDSDGYITLMDKGREIAERMYERHVIIAKTLMGIGVDEETALAESCKIEHDISEKTFGCIKAYYDKMKSLL